MKVVCYATTAHGRSPHIAKAMCEGFKKHGISARVSFRYNGVEADLAVAYGWANSNIFNDYKRAGKHFLYVDLGFWNRRPVTDRWNGYHKVVLDGWCPLETMKRGCPGDRLKVHSIELAVAEPGEHLIIAGMSAKSAMDHGFSNQEWETRAAEALLAKTKRPIVYRSKPSWKGARSIPGTTFANNEDAIDQILKGARLLVTHHSNTAVDAIVAGVPVYCEQGVGAALSTANLTDIENPRRPSDAERIGLLNDIAWIQWSPYEMRTGACWAHYRELIK